MTAQQIANQFMAAYSDYAWVYKQIQDECLYLFGNAKSFSLKACEWMEQDADNMEAWIMENVCVELMAHNWPKFGSKEFHTAVQDVYYKNI